jgi:hypothetical protein
MLAATGASRCCVNYSPPAATASGPAEEETRGEALAPRHVMGRSNVPVFSP